MGVRVPLTGVKVELRGGKRLVLSHTSRFVETFIPKELDYIISRSILSSSKEDSTIGIHLTLVVESQTYGCIP